MSRPILLYFVVLACIGATSSSAQEALDPELALYALPGEHRAGASLYAFREDGSFEPLRKADGVYFCLADRSGDERFSVACHPKSAIAFMERASVLNREHAERADSRTALANEFRSGELPFPRAIMSHYASGAVDAATGHPLTLRHWMEIGVPFATPEEMGVTDQNMGERPWMMNVGEVGAHVMLDYRTITWSEYTGKAVTDASIQD